MKAESEFNVVSLIEAKANFTKILTKVEKGNPIIITRKGNPVAQIIPYSETKTFDLDKIISEFKGIRSKIKGHFDIKKAINEGRKF